MARKIVVLVVALFFAVPAVYAEEPPTHLRQSIANLKLDGATPTASAQVAQRPSWAASRGEEKALIAIGLGLLGFYLGEALSGANSEEGAMRAGLVVGGTVAVIVLMRP